MMGTSKQGDLKNWVSQVA